MRTEELYQSLSHSGLMGLKIPKSYKVGAYSVDMDTNGCVDGLIKGWLDKWMTEEGITHVHNPLQSSPDFWLDPDNLEEDWLEVKSFTGSPNFDVASFRSFINLVVEKPWKLHSKHLLIKYKSEGGIITVEKVWLKNLWEICCTSKRWPLKVQYKNRVIVNIRPSTWYSDSPEFPSFESLEDFLAALEETVYRYHDTRNTIAEHWSENLCRSYRRHYGRELVLPRWNDIKDKYVTAP